MTLLAALTLLALLIWCGMIFCHGRFWQAGPILPPAPMGLRLPAVDIVVPARDEAESIAAAIGSLTRQVMPGGAAIRVFLVDDGSSDGTAAIARTAADGAPNPLTVITGTDKPADWSGKLWAVRQGVAATSADLILLTDADIAHDPDHLARLVAKAEAGRYDMVSEMVLLNCDSFAERALVPAFVYFFQLLYPFAKVDDPASRVGGAAGGTVLIRRSALDRIGGIEVMRGALIDDVTLGRAVKKSGGRTWLGHTKRARSIRLYPHFSDIWAMVARSAYVQLGFSPLNLLGTIVGMLLVWLLPPAGAIFGHGAARAFGLIAWVLMAGSYVPSIRRYGLSPLWGIFLPLIALFYMAATVGSAVNHMRGRSVMWKNRVYVEGGS
ncbi:glycosyltransferase [Acidisoma silvae]|uniref:Glycosyltransferase n=1 Tax=Acidisoma silvae TaxID=2802396 RepID=A0A964DZF9_9PROT|nr:glycosyltransferase [Acidisoma silvae]MCB8876241.1 glycosyltransferase [Acidisoma silvae]